MGKSHLVAKPIVEARTRYHLAHSQISAPIMLAGRCLIPYYLRFLLKFTQIEIRQPERIITALRDFQARQTRLIVAFRHPYGDEPQLIYHVFNNLLYRWAKRNGQSLSRRPHLRMVHDYAVPLWGDALIRYVLPRSGAVPVYHIKFDPESLRQIRMILADDPCPLGIAPEGQISYHSETLPRIEQGTIRIGFWCARDLEHAGRSERVQVLPISIHYQYDWRDIRKVRQAINQLETLCGLTASTASFASAERHTEPAMLAELQAHIDPIEDRILEIAEAYYAQTSSHQSQPSGSSPVEARANRQQRWAALTETALEAAEKILGLVPNSAEIYQRVYRIRQEGWDRIYPVTAVDRLSPLESALADRRAGEAWYAMRHMEFVDLMSYHDVNYLAGSSGAAPSYDRIVETVVNLQDLAARLMGGNITNRPNVIRKKAVIIPAAGLDLTARLPDYRRDAKKAAQAATDELSRQFRSCIQFYREHLH